MIEKKRILLFVCCLACFLTGCGKVIDLTDEETQLIAEYSAELLLKYDLNYVDRLDDGSKKDEEESTEELEAVTEEMSSETTEEKPSEVTTEDPQQKPDENKDSNDDVTVGSESNIAVIAGIDDVDIKFREYVIVDKYPATDEQGEFIYLEASQGYHLLVLKFDVVNKGNDVISISMLDKKIDYRIVCNGSKAAKPMLTILMDDLGTLETNVEASKSQEAVLVFQIADEMKKQLKTMDFYVTYNETENKIIILQ